VVCHEAGQGLVVHALQGFVLQRIEDPDKVIDKEGDVLHSFPEGRQHQFEDIDAVVEVLPEPALFNQFLEVLVGSGNDPGVMTDALHTPQGFVGLFLKDPEEANLQGRGDVADFVEEEGSLIG